MARQAVQERDTKKNPGLEPVESVRLNMKPLPPFDFDLSATIFSGGDPEFRHYDGERFRQVVRVNGKLALATVRSTGTIEEPRLAVELASHQVMTPADKQKARETIRSMFNLDIDLRQFYSAIKGDPVMSGIAKKLYGLKSPTTPTVYEALVDSIIEQQISLIAAHSMQLRLIKAFGDELEMEGSRYYAFPTPERLAGASVAELKACGLSGRKSEYIKDISFLVSAGKLDLEKFESYEDVSEIRDELSRVRGIGAWTAEMVMIRGLHKMDSIPADDIGLQAKLSHFYGGDGRATSEELLGVAEKWGRWRGLGGYYLIMAHMKGLVPRGDGAWQRGHGNVQ